MKLERKARKTQEGWVRRASKVGCCLDILIFSCCLTNYHKLSNLKHICHLTFFQLVLCSGSQSRNQVVHQLYLLWRLDQGKIHLRTPWGRRQISFPPGSRTEVPLSCWLLAGGHCWVLVARPSVSVTKTLPHLGSLCLPSNLSDFRYQLLFKGALVIGSGPDHVPMLRSAVPASNLITGVRASLTAVSGIMQAVCVRQGGRKSWASQDSACHSR